MKPSKLCAALLVIGWLAAGAAGAQPEMIVRSAEAVALDAGNISMDFENALLKDVLKVFSQLSRLNFVASSDIEQRRTTVYFDNVPVQDALNALMTANNLRFEQRAGTSVFIVYSAAATAPTLETRIIKLKYTRLTGSPVDTASAAIGGFSAGTSTGTSTGTATTASTGASAGGGGGVTGGRTIDKIVQGMLTKDGKLSIDFPSNSMIVTDLPENIAKIEEIMAALDKPAPQVVIEVYFMEVNKSDTKDIGLEWGGTNGQFLTLTGGSAQSAFPFNIQPLENRQVDDANTGVNKALTLGTLSATSFRAILHAITTLGNTRILAQPRLLTMNNEAAEIKLMTDTAIASVTTTSTSEGINTTTQNADREELGISLIVTPQINLEDGTVLLYANPSVSTASASAFFPTTFLDPTTREVRTVARVKNHQTLVIGGLLDNNDDRAYRKVPFLGDLPLVGHAFKYTDTSSRDRELIIFITPHIVEGYQSVGADSATAAFGGRDAALDRVMDAFQEEKLGRLADRFDAVEDEKTGLLRREQELLRQSARSAMTPTVERQMTKAMEEVGRSR